MAGQPTAAFRTRDSEYDPTFLLYNPTTIAPERVSLAAKAEQGNYVGVLQLLAGRDKDSGGQGNNNEENSSSTTTSSTPVIVAAVLGTVLVFLIGSLLVYFLRRRYGQTKATTDAEYPFTKQVARSRAFLMMQRQPGPAAEHPQDSAAHTLATSQSYPTLSTNTAVEPDRDPWESRNFYSTPKHNKNAYPGRRVGQSRPKVETGSNAPSRTSKSSKSTSSSQRIRRAIRGSMVTTTTESMTEVSSIRFSPDTERQMEIDERIQELQGKLALLERTINRGGISREAKTGSVTLANMTHDYRVWKWKKQIEKLKSLKDSDWAWGRTDVVPPGLYRFEGPSTFHSSV